VEPNIWFDPQFLEEFESQAEPVAIPAAGLAPPRVRDMEGAIVNDGFPSSLQTGGCGGSSGAQ
jgi:hypothetical protein